MNERQPFRIEIENPTEIYETFEEPTSERSTYSLGETALYYPFRNLTVSAISDGHTYNSIVQLSPVVNYSNYSWPDVSIPIDSLKKDYKLKQLGESVYILDESEKPEFELIGSGIAEPTIQVYVGRGQYGAGNTPRKQVGDLEQFVSGLERYKGVIETLVNGVYEREGINLDEVVMYWRPPMNRRGTSVTSNYSGFDLSSLFGGKYEDLKGKIEIQNPGVHFKDIGGQEQAKREIQGLSFALKNPDLYSKWGTRPPKGILLYGPPGTGKTLMAKALATEADAKFYHVKVSDVTSKWYGESEKIIQSVFDLAKENGKTIVFFDELDAIAPRRDFSHEASGRIVSTMLVNLDGIEKNQNLMVVGSTNRIDSIDPALTRPGRIDRLVEVPLPDKTGREQIFGIHKLQAEAAAKRTLFDEGIYTSLINQEKFSGADIAEIVRRTLEEKVREEGESGKEPTLVSEEDIEKQVKFYERTKEVRNKIGF